MTRYPLFDRSRLQLKPLDQRGHDLRIADVWPLDPPEQPYEHEGFAELIGAIVQARTAGRPVILMMGAHPIKLGLSRFVVDLIERGVVTHLATNGAGVIHDFELAAGDGTSEDVASWIRAGQFGLWCETGHLNQVIVQAAARGDGLGEGIGRYIQEQQLPHRQLSLAAAAWRKRIPLTCHVSVGSDIIHSHPNCDGAALGQTSYTDFLIFARAIQDLEGGVYLNVGSAVTGPEVYLKALSMSRNVARQEHRSIRHFTTAVFDLVPLPGDHRRTVPDKSHSLYYFRPWKTILVRTVADGGQSYYFPGDHRRTLPTLWHQVVSNWSVRTGPRAA